MDRKDTGTGAIYSSSLPCCFVVTHGTHHLGHALDRVSVPLPLALSPPHPQLSLFVFHSDIYALRQPYQRCPGGMFTKCSGSQLLTGFLRWCQPTLRHPILVKSGESFSCCCRPFLSIIFGRNLLDCN